MKDFYDDKDDRELELDFDPDDDDNPEVVDSDEDTREEDEEELDSVEARDDEEAALGSELSQTAYVSCPYCGENVELYVDPSGGDLQEYVEDCEVCCQPWSVRLSVDQNGVPRVEVSALDQ